MYLVDTSIWIHALRLRGNPSIQAQLKPLLLGGEAAVTDWIILELMTGLARSEKAEDLLERLSPLTCLSFRPEWWPSAWDLAAALRKQGASPSAAACLIATAAIESAVPLIHCGRDFEEIRQHSRLQTLDWTAYLG